MKIYTASSWRNPRYAQVVQSIKDAYFEVYDFQNPWDKGAAFNWNQIDPDWEHWTMEQFIQALKHPIARRGFESDLKGMWWADVCVLILPCGRSAHMEAGYFLGHGRPVHILLDGERPELTYSLATCHTNIHDLIYSLKIEEEIQKSTPAKRTADSTESEK